MRLLCLLFSLALLACSHSTPAPVTPAPALKNVAIDYAHMLAPAVPCTSLGDSAAFCDFGRVIAYCHVGGGAPGCDALADFRPKQSAPQGKPAEPAKEPPKPADVPKPDPKPPAKK